MKGREWRDFCGSQWDFWTANRVQNFITDCEPWQSLEFPVCTDTMKVNGYFGNKFPCRENGNFGDYPHGRFCDSFTCFFFFPWIQMKMSIKASEMPEDNASGYRPSLLQVGSMGQQHQNLLVALWKYRISTLPLPDLHVKGIPRSSEYMGIFETH